MIDLTGQVFGRLTVIESTDQRDVSRSVKWLCRCSYGNETLVNTHSLRSGHTQSCGCLQKERAKETHKKYNVFQTKGDVAIGYTESGVKFLIDREDLARVSEYCWCVANNGYIVSRIGDKQISLHRFILNVHDEKVVDHKDRDKTNNRKTNLRIVTPQQNNMNRGIHRNNTIGLKGVYKSKNGERYIAQICKDGQRIHIGTYDTLEKARQARIEKEIELFGEFACLEDEGR